MRQMRARKFICMLCVVLMSITILPVQTFSVKAADEGIPLSLTQAKALALANSKSYKKLVNKVTMTQVKYVESVKSAVLKRVNMMTFRWTPLLSFKFPEWPDLVTSYEWQYKPAQIQNDIAALRHELNDVKFEVTEKISNLFVKVYTQQEKISFTEERLAVLEETILRTEVKVKMGEAAQSDLDKMLQSQNKLNSDLALLLRSFESSKRNIKDMIRLDVSVGYVFADPFVKSEIERSVLPELTEYTLEQDQAFYETKMNTKLGLLSVEINERLMSGQYGDKMNYIRPYITQVKNGIEIDGDAFKSSYDQFLEAVDSPWQGSWKILFIKIPKTWIKGSLDGVRYVEDEPYALYTATLDYEDLLAEQESSEQDLRKQVSDSFEALITARNAYDSMQIPAEQLESELEKAAYRNQIGELSYEELSAMQEEYETYQLDMLDTLASYSELLYSFDRLTCGGITKYLNGESLSIENASGGNSFLEAEYVDGLYYYIQSKVEDNLFLFSVSVPEDFSVEITDFELWVDGTQIGDRTSIANELRHLTLSLDNVEKASVRLYNGEEFVDECEFDPMESSGPLNVVGGFVPPKSQEEVVASFTYKRNETLDMTAFTFTAKPGKGIAYYQIQDTGGEPIYDSEPVPLERSFSYLSLLEQDLSRLRIALYDKDQNLLYTGTLKDQTLEVIVKSD